MNKTLISEQWSFAKTTADSPETLKGESLHCETVSLPHTWYTDDDQYRGKVVYQKTIPAVKGDTILVEFPGADQRCKVYVNGVFAAEHQGAYSRFFALIPESELGAPEWTVQVFLDNSISEHVSPNHGDFTIFGGLYREVSLLALNKVHFDRLYYGTEGLIIRTEVGGSDTGLFYLEPHVVSDGRKTLIRYTVFDDGKPVLKKETRSVESVTLSLEHVRCWNGQKDPHLYTVRAELLDEEGVLDAVELRTGFAAYRMTPEEGFFLNGEHMKLKGVAKHQDFGGCYSAVTKTQIDRDFDLIDEIGANAVRLSHYQHPQYTYDLCDERGLLVWAEIPMLKMTEDRALLENAKEQLRELILQNIHHPSIFCWGIQNEIAMFRDTAHMHEGCRELYGTAKELDSQRLVTAANLYSVKAESELNAITDMIGYNLYFGWYYGEIKDYDDYLEHFHAVRPDMPIGISEYGVDARTALHAVEPKVRDYSEEYQAHFHEHAYPIFESKPWLWGSFIWNLFDFSSAGRDEGGQKFINAKGLVTYDRSECKDAFYYYKAKWTAAPFLHICSKRFVKRAADRIDVKLYTNLASATLECNGQRLEAQSDGNGTILFTDVPLVPGENLIRAFSGSVFDECTFERVEQEEESYRLPDSGDGHVKNWFLAENDVVKEGFYSIVDTAQDLMENDDTKAALKKYFPKVAELLEQEVIPWGLSMQSILSRGEQEPDSVTALNTALNGIPRKIG